jgi:hypothetical protein
MDPEGKKNFPEEDKTKNSGWVVEIRGTTSYSQRIRYEEGGIEKTEQIEGQQFITRTLLRNLQREAKNLPPAPKDANGNPDPEKLALLDPVRGRVSHIFLWHAFKDLNPQLNKYLYLDNPPLADSLVVGASATMGGPGGSPVGSPGGPPASEGSSGMEPGGPGAATATPTIFSWRPLTASGGASGGGSGSSFGGPGEGGPSLGGPRGGPSFGGGFGSGSSAGSNPYVPKGGSTASGSSFGGPGGLSGEGGIGGTTPKAPATEKKPQVRYEFIIHMIWREPTPSDKFNEPTN